MVLFSQNFSSGEREVDRGIEEHFLQLEICSPNFRGDGAIGEIYNVVLGRKTRERGTTDEILKKRYPVARK